MTHLLVDDVDFKEGVIRIRSKPWLFWTVKTRRRRDVPLVEETSQSLRTLIGKRKAGFVFLNAGIEGDPAKSFNTPQAMRDHVEKIAGELCDEDADLRRHCQRDFRGITVRHLRNSHDYEGDHPILEYKRRFNLDKALCADSRGKISTAKTTFWARKGQGWTRKKLLAEIRRRHRAGQSLRRRQLPVRIYEAGRRLFGTWQEAVETAGLDYEDASGIRRWTPAKVVAAIKKLAAKGRSLCASDVEQRDPQLFNAAVNQFPRSWGKALRAAGFDPDEHKQSRGRWNQQKAINWVENRLAKQRSVLARDAPRDLQDFVRKRIGKSWIAFIESFGIRYPGVKKRRDWTKPKVLSEIRARSATGRPMNYRAIKQDYQALLHQAQKFFGTWDRALAAAVLVPRELESPPLGVSV